MAKESVGHEPEKDSKKESKLFRNLAIGALALAGLVFLKHL